MPSTSDEDSVSTQVMCEDNQDDKNYDQKMQSDSVDANSETIHQLSNLIIPKQYLVMFIVNQKMTSRIKKT